MQFSKLLRSFIESKIINVFITFVILVNAITLGLETSEKLVSKIGNILIYIDKIALSIFVIELLIKLFVYKLNFFRSGWNVFDFIIVTVALIPSSGPLSILRAFRIFRALRLLSMIPSMKKVIQAMFYAIPGIASVGTIILLIFYISAVLVTNFFGNKFENWFGTIGDSMYSLFQIMTLESWSMGIVRPVMEEYPYAWAFFVPFILITTFAVLNLFIGIIVDAMQNQTIEDENKNNQNSQLNLEEKVISIENELKEMGKNVKQICCYKREKFQNYEHLKKDFESANIIIFPSKFSAEIYFKEINLIHQKTFLGISPRINKYVESLGFKIKLLDYFSNDLEGKIKEII